MFLTLVRKEILNNLLDFRFSLAYVLCTFLLIGSAGIMLADYLEEQRIYQTSRNIYQRQIEDREQLWQHLWQAKSVARPPLLTKILAVGGERDPDLRAEVAPEFSPYFKGDFQRNPLVNFFPALDMVFIVGGILSLLIFVLTYNAIAGEREDGTLKLLLSAPMPRDSLILAKWMGGFLSLLIPFFISCIIITLVLLLTPGVTSTGEEWIRIGGIFLACALFVAVVFSISMTVSAISRSSSTAILILLVVWAVGILILPSVSTGLSYLILSPPGVQQSGVEMRRMGIVSYNNWDERRESHMKSLFGGRERDALNPSERQEWDKANREFWLDNVTRISEEIIGVGQAMTRDEARVENLARWINRLSPYGCLQNIAVDLARTGFHREVELREGVEEYGRKTLEFVLSAYRENRQSLDPAMMPGVRFPGEKLSESFGRTVIDFGILVIMGTLFFLAAFLSFLRMDIA